MLSLWAEALLGWLPHSIWGAHTDPSAISTRRYRAIASLQSPNGAFLGMAIESGTSKPRAAAAARLRAVL
jgi:hypothetical protein